MTPCLPNLFLIGGMKCGSTTLYSDLALHSNIFAPETKEPTFLEQETLPLDKVGSLYQTLHRKGKQHRYRMDGSTRYSMRTELQGIPEKLAEICGQDLRIVYLVRNPFDRVASHYRHGFGAGMYTESLSQAVFADPAIMDHTRYAWQLEPWRDVFGPEVIYVMQFEAYVQDRYAAVADVQSWLGLSPEVENIDSSDRKNASAGKTAPSGWISRVTQSPFYKTKIAPCLPRTLLNQAKRLTHRPLPEASVVWTEPLRKHVSTALRNDVKQISEWCSFPKCGAGVLWEDFA